MLETIAAPVPPVSTIPYGFVFQEINSALLELLGQCAYDRFYKICEILRLFAKERGIIPYSQNLIGIYAEYTVSFADKPDDPFYPTALEHLRLAYDHYNDLAIVNHRAAKGHYISPVVLRNTESHKSNLASWITGVMKDIIACGTDHKGSSIVEFVNKDDTLPLTMVENGVSDYAAYTQVTLTIASKAVQSVVVDAPQIEFIRNRASDYLRSLQITDPKLEKFYFSIHSSYDLTTQQRSSLKSSGRYSGIAHVSDLLFGDSNLREEPDLSLYLDDEKQVVTGHIGAFKLGSEPVVHFADLPNAYPARFLHSVRNSASGSQVLSDSLVMWSPMFKTKPADIRGQEGVEFVLGSSSGFCTFRRIKMYDLTDSDFYFLSAMGYYFSGKLDGVAASIEYVNGVYLIGFRDGLRRSLHSVDGVPFTFGSFTGSLNVEIFPSGETPDGRTKYKIFYLGRSPNKYPKDVSNRFNYWRSYFSDFKTRVDADKKIFRGLYFKPYFYIPPFSPDAANFSVDIHDAFRTLCNFDPMLDGLVFQDVYGAFSAFWKPFTTMDVYVRRNGDLAVSGDYMVDIDSVTYPAIDPDHVYVSDGVYESFFTDGCFSLIHRRLDKIDTNSTVVPVHNRLFRYSDRYVDLGVFKVRYDHRPLGQYFKFVGAAYRSIITENVNLNIETSDLERIYGVLKDTLSRVAPVFDSTYSVPDFVQAVLAKFVHDPQKLWAVFYKNKYITPNPFDISLYDHYGRLVPVITLLK